MNPISAAALDILKALYNADEELSGYAIIQATRRASGTIYPLLERLAAEGLIARRAETREEWIHAGANRPIRKYYLISPPGLAALNEAAPWPLAIDPPGCGCTECITGEYVPFDQATDEQIAALLRGEIHDNVGDGLTVTASVRVSCGDFTREIDPRLLGIIPSKENPS